MAIASVTIDDATFAAAMAKLKPLTAAEQRAVLRGPHSRAATLIKRTGRQLAPVGSGLNPRGRSRAHLRDALVSNTKTTKTGGLSTVVGADYKVAPHLHLAHNPVKAVTVKPKTAKVLSNLKSVGGNKGIAKVFGRVVNIPARPGKPFLKTALESNLDRIKGFFVAAIERRLSGGAG